LWPRIFSAVIQNYFGKIGFGVSFNPEFPFEHRIIGASMEYRYTMINSGSFCVSLHKNSQHRIEFGGVPGTEKNNMLLAAVFHVFKFKKKK
jgi:hypothetical protein